MSILLQAVITLVALVISYLIGKSQNKIGQVQILDSFADIIRPQLHSATKKLCEDLLPTILSTTLPLEVRNMAVAELHSRLQLLYSVDLQMSAQEIARIIQSVYKEYAIPVKENIITNDEVPGEAAQKCAA